MDYLCSYSEFSRVWYYCSEQNSPTVNSCLDMSFNYKKSNSKKSNIQPLNMGKCNMMPTPSGSPWNVHDMPWSSNIPNSHVMEFNAQPWDANITSSARLTPCKRKSDIEPTTPLKQHISEEKMAAHFNNLHISLDYPTKPIPDDSYVIDSLTNNNDLNMSADTTDLETRLKSAQKIVLCEEMRRLKNDPIVPLSLLNSIEKPCKAIVLWQPPSTLQNHIHLTNSLVSDQEQDNNNCSDLDLNNMGMEMDT